MIDHSLTSPWYLAWIEGFCFLDYFVEMGWLLLVLCFEDVVESFLSVRLIWTISCDFGCPCLCCRYCQARWALFGYSLLQGVLSWWFCPRANSVILPPRKSPCSPQDARWYSRCLFLLHGNLRRNMFQLTILSQFSSCSSDLPYTQDATSLHLGTYLHHFRIPPWNLIKIVLCICNIEVYWVYHHCSTEWCQRLWPAGAHLLAPCFQFRKELLGSVAFVARLHQHESSMPISISRVHKGLLALTLHSDLSYWRLHQR